MKEAKKVEADVALELLKLQHTFQDGLRRGIRTRGVRGEVTVAT